MALLHYIVALLHYIVPHTNTCKIMVELNQTLQSEKTGPPMTTLRYFISDCAVKDGHALRTRKSNLRKSSSSSYTASSSEEFSSSRPMHTIAFTKTRHCQLDGLGSTDSISSIVSAITLPDAFTCNRENSHVRFDHSPTTQGKSTLDDVPRFPIRQGSVSTEISLPEVPSSHSEDFTPKKPERKRAQENRLQVRRWLPWRRAPDDVQLSQ